MFSCRCPCHRYYQHRCNCYCNEKLQQLQQRLNDLKKRAKKYKVKVIVLPKEEIHILTDEERKIIDQLHDDRFGEYDKLAREKHKYDWFAERYIEKLNKKWSKK